jgi:hypothetical protein
MTRYGVASVATMKIPLDAARAVAASDMGLLRGEGLLLVDPAGRHLH